VSELPDYLGAVLAASSGRDRWRDVFFLILATPKLVPKFPEPAIQFVHHILTPLAKVPELKGGLLTPNFSPFFSEASSFPQVPFPRGVQE